MFFRSIIDNSRSIIDSSRSVNDDSRVMLQLVASFTIVIFLWYRPQGKWYSKTCFRLFVKTHFFLSGKWIVGYFVVING